jgi:hypothetical protein
MSRLIAAAMWLGVVVASPQQTTSFGPILQLEKTIYLADESIRFWVGVSRSQKGYGLVHPSLGAPRWHQAGRAGELAN